MITQILALIVALTMLYFLSQLRHFILARDKDKRRYYRAYIVGFDETDWGSDSDDNSSNESDSKDTTILHMAGRNSLVEWPTELELQAVPSAHLLEIAVDDCDEAASTATFTNYL